MLRICSATAYPVLQEFPRLARIRLIVARDRSLLRRLPPRQVEQHLVDVAPAPAFRRIVAFDHGMAGGVEMRGCMLVGRVVATADMAAATADAQMQPAAAGLQALLASERARRDVLDPGNMAASLCCHCIPPRRLRASIQAIREATAPVSACRRDSRA